jgi:ATP-dependent helicase/nuclease subunit A
MTAAPKLTPQDIAAHPENSAWVAASAGTGKTHVLTTRVLRLMLAGTLPDRILCLTYTRAAAAEMANRIQNRLRRWATCTDEALDQELRALHVTPTADSRTRARQLFAQVLDMPGGLKIVTIHAFCQALLARFPLEAALPPHFETMDDRSAAEAVQEASDHLLLAAGGDDALMPALSRIARRLSEFSFPELLGELQGRRGALERLKRAHQVREGLTVAIRRALGLGADETAATVRAGLCEDTHNALADMRSLAAAYAQGTESEQRRGDMLARWLAATPAQRQETLDDYADVFLTKAGEPRKADRLVTKGTLKRLPNALDIFVTEQFRLAAGYDKLRLIEVADNSAAVLALAFAFLDVYDDEKRRRAVLDYDDLILATLNLLATPDIAPWVLYKLDGGLDHVLVDEAQDTNPEQWRVIKFIADEFFSGWGARDDVVRTVFAVGDVKQSIYSFQGAEPEEFHAARDHFKVRADAVDAIFVEPTLDVSFRSTDAVLTFVDEVFTDDNLKRGLLELKYRGHGVQRQGDAGLVELWPPEEPDEAEEVDGWVLPFAADKSIGPEARLARRMARTIAGWLASGEILPSAGRPIRAGDILVLVRRRTAFDQLLISALKSLGVPVAGADRMVVTDSIAVMDLMALAQTALLPDDDLTLATVLKSPLVGLDEDALYDLAHDRGDKSLWRSLAAKASARAEYDAAYRYLSRVLARADFMPPFEFFSTLLTETDAQGISGRQRIFARLGEEAGDPLDEFLALALQYEAVNTPSLQGFLHWLAVRPAEIKRDGEQARDEVRIMTVHGAKGLEAPIVFLPDTCGQPRDGSRLLWLGHPSGDALLPIWPGKSDNERGPCATARQRQKMKSQAEQARLLYVALTRASDRLYICGWTGTKGKAKDCWYEYLEAAFARLPGVVEVEGADGPVRRYETPQRRPVAAARGPVAVKTPEGLPDWARRLPPTEPSPVRPLAPSRMAEAEPAVASPLTAAEAATRAAVRFRRGTLIHRLLELLPDLPPAARAEAGRRFLAQPAHNLDGAAIDALVAEVLTVLNDPAFAALFAPGSRAEVPVTGLLGTTPVTGQIDRLAVTDDAVLVVDYKTNRPPPAAVADTPRAYVRQMAAYRRLLQDLYPGRLVRCALLWTDAPRLMELPAAMLDEIIFS